jgi:hypothetical protein
MQKPTTFHDDSANETIVAREPESSVSHFIDGNRAARRLCPSLGRCQARQHSNGESHEDASKVVDRSFTAASVASNSGSRPKAKGRHPMPALSFAL